MKRKMFLIGTMALMVAGSIFWSCQKDEFEIDSENGLMLKSASNCNDCVSVWMDSKETMTGWTKKNTSAPVLSQLQLIVWNDYENVHFKIKATTGTFTKVTIGGSQVWNTEGTTEYTWDVPITNFEKCDEITVADILLGGVSGGVGNTEPESFTYYLREVSTTTTIIASPNPVCTEDEVTVTGTVISDEVITGGIIKIVEGDAVVASANASVGTVEFKYTPQTAGMRTFKAVYDRVSGYCASESQTLDVVAQVCGGCKESFSYTQNSDGTYTFTYIPAEVMEGAELVFTFAQGTYLSGLDGWNNNGVTYQTTVNFKACVPVSWTVALQANCNGKGQSKANVWTDFKVNDVSKKGKNDNIELPCPE